MTLKTVKYNAYAVAEWFRAVNGYNSGTYIITNILKCKIRFH